MGADQIRYFQTTFFCTVLNLRYGYDLFGISREMNDIHGNLLWYGEYTAWGCCQSLVLRVIKIIDIRMINYQRMSYYKMLIYLILKKLKAQSAMDNIELNTNLTRYGIYIGLLRRGWEIKMIKAIQEKVILNEIKEISLNRIGGNIPKYFNDKQDCISEMMFYGCFEHPLKTNFVLSIFLPKNHDVMLDNNIYPNCAIKVFTHPKSEESEITSFTNMDLNRIYFEPYRKANSDDLSGLVTVGGELQLIQEEEYYYKKFRRKTDICT